MPTSLCPPNIPHASFSRRSFFALAATAASYAALGHGLQSAPATTPANTRFPARPGQQKPEVHITQSKAF